MGKYLCDPVQIFSLSETNISNDIEIVSISTGRKHINYDCVFIYAQWMIRLWNVLWRGLPALDYNLIKADCWREECYL